MGDYFDYAYGNFLINDIFKRKIFRVEPISLKDYFFGEDYNKNNYKEKFQKKKRTKIN